MPEASLRFDEFFEGEIMDAVDGDGYSGGRGVWEGDGLGFAVAGEFAGDQEFDANAGLRVAEVAGAGEGRDVTKTV